MAEETLYRLRVRYAETGRLRYLSHLELLRAVERAVRRSGVPYAVTQGFHPRLKAAYGPALPVGVSSQDEWFDLWVRERRPAEEYLAALAAAFPADLAPREVAYVDGRAASLSAGLSIACWDVELGVWADEASKLGVDALLARVGPAEVEAACAAVCASGSITYLRDGKPKTVALEGRVARTPRVFPRADGAPGARIELVTRATNEGALRPDVFMGAVRLQLAESLAVRGDAPGDPAAAVVSCQRCLRAAVVRTAQYLEGDDGTWVRPI
jgi:radical SAM-linked protein